MLEFLLTYLCVAGLDLMWPHQSWLQRRVLGWEIEEYTSSSLSSLKNWTLVLHWSSVRRLQDTLKDILDFVLFYAYVTHFDRKHLFRITYKSNWPYILQAVEDFHTQLTTVANSLLEEFRFVNQIPSLAKPCTCLFTILWFDPAQNLAKYKKRLCLLI